jgi:hypothetical protein
MGAGCGGLGRPGREQKGLTGGGWLAAFSDAPRLAVGVGGESFCADARNDTNALECAKNSAEKYRKMRKMRSIERKNTEKVLLVSGGKKRSVWHQDAENWRSGGAEKAAVLCDCEK